ncbi:MAG: PEP-CTERM sorting domain-containing protein [Phycisphaerae bacterium]|nr:PEP-CTERM sorting domain-containing protein [Phycisphaerae bacterium]
MRRGRFLAATAMAVVMLAAATAQADIVQRTYFFTGADLINNVFDSTARYSTDGSLKVFEGMRQIGPAEGTAVGATFLTDGYLTAFNNTWAEAVTSGRLLARVSLSGNNGFSGQWGEDYKPFEWVGGTGPAGWTFSLATLSSPKAGGHTDQYPVWEAAAGDGLTLDATDLADEVFSVTIKFDTDDMWWGNPDNYLYGCNTAPNDIDLLLTAYFNSYFYENGEPVNRYVGNMAMEIPEPATMGLLGLGLVGLLRRRRTQK